MNVFPMIIQNIRLKPKLRIYKSYVKSLNSFIALLFLIPPSFSEKLSIELKSPQINQGVEKVFLKRNSTSIYGLSPKLPNSQSCA